MKQGSAMPRGTLRLLAQMPVLVLLASSPVARLHGQELVAHTELYQRLRTEAANVIHHRRGTPPSASRKPELRLCSGGHFHFSVGEHGIYCDGFWGDDVPMETNLGATMFDARLEMEWFWQGIPNSQRGFWTPYFVEAATEINALESRFRACQTKEQQETELLQFMDTLPRIWHRGASEFARRHGRELRMEGGGSAPCAPAESVSIVIASDRRYQGLQRIEWSPAASVWRAIVEDREPLSFQAIQSGSTKELMVGAKYYYRFVINGTTTRKQLCPDVPTQSGMRMVLPWPGWQ